MMALKVVREILGAEQTLPVPLRSNQAKSTLSPFQGASSTLAQSIFFKVPFLHVPSCFLSLEGDG
uniref:Chromosome 5 open reading frame 62 n=3 Tax=Homininae TaxID=207598 RepID=K6ZLH3_PANTR